VLKAWIKNTYNSAQKLINGFQPERVAVYTASVSWFIILSFLPFLIVLLSLVRFLPFISEDTVTLHTGFIPVAFQELLQSFLKEITDHTSAVILPLGALTGLLSASTGFSSLMRGLNIVYKQEETRPWWFIRLMSVVYTVVFMCILIAVLILLVFGKSIYYMLLEMFPQVAQAVLSVVNLRFWAAVLILTVFFTLLYKTVPNRKTKWYGEIPGAFFSACAWMIFSHLYSLYISNFNRFSMIYGSLALIILLMIWLYACIYIVFIGGYVNVLLQNVLPSKWLLRQKTEK